MIVDLIECASNEEFFNVVVNGQDYSIGFNYSSSNTIVIEIIGSNDEEIIHEIDLKDIKNDSLVDIIEIIKKEI